jgi:hypothetical protein
MNTVTDRQIAQTISAARSPRNLNASRPARRTVVTLLAAVIALAALGLAPRQAPAESTSSPSSIGESQPINIVANPSMAEGGNPISSTVSVSSTGTTVQVGCDRPDLVASPTGSWPYSDTFPTGGSTSQTQGYATAAVSANSAVHIYVCPSGVDSSNPANWTSYTTVTLVP